MEQTSNKYNWILPVGILLGGYLLINGIGKKLGLWSSTKNLDAQTNPQSPSYNAWQTEYWKQYSLNPPMSYGTAKGLAMQIKSYASIFKDDFDVVMAALKGCTNKRQVSYVSYVFEELYNKDMYQYLMDGNGYAVLGDGLSDSQLQQVNDYVSNLPNK